MSLPRGLHLLVGDQALQAVLADRLKHNQAGFLAFLLDLLQQAFVNKRGHVIHDLPCLVAIVKRCAERLDSLQSTTANKDGEPPEEPPLFRI